MALRAFRSNPSIGGFGGESGVAAVIPAFSDAVRGRCNGGGTDDRLPATAATNDAPVVSTREKGKAGKRGRQSDRGGEANGKGDGGGRGGDCPRPVPTAPAAATTAAKSSGSGESSCDAFAQIVKELVDNAVDACGGGGGDEKGCSTTDVTPVAESEEERASPAVLRRVRVQIDAARHCDDDGRATDTGAAEVLRVTVSDNGCGMGSIEDCVAAFRTSKGVGVVGGRGDTSEYQDDDDGIRREDGSSEQRQQQEHTAGRYGIGLTLCLLHAQRLVPNSKASITSATASSAVWTMAAFVVDADSDEVRCVEKKTRQKWRRDESGTAVSLLVPGGDAAQRSWPRLAEYLSRFQLSIHLKCSLEVKAPTLSSMPLFIRPPVELERRAMIQQSRQQERRNQTSGRDSCRREGKHMGDDDSASWNDGMADSGSAQGTQADGSQSETETGSQQNIAETTEVHLKGGSRPKFNQAEQKRELEDRRRRLIRQGVLSFLKTPIELRNVAHSLQPIRQVRTDIATDSVQLCSKFSAPMLEVDLVVYKPEEVDANDEEEDDLEEGGDEFDDVFPQMNVRRQAFLASGPETSGSSARLMLVRMVNRIPLLDSAEASACGIVRALSNQIVWNSFGLDVSPITNHEAVQNAAGISTPSVLSPDLHIPTYSVKDSVQVAPFFQSNTHSLFEFDNDNHSNSDDNEDDDEHGNSENKRSNTKRKRKKTLRLFPAGLRLGNVLIITQIHARPSSLPLPTLSKGRLPLNDKGIDDALQVGLYSCLRSLQRTNPALLLTSQQLKETERDNRYIPALSASLASIVSRSKNNVFQRTTTEKIFRWENRRNDAEGPKRGAPEVTPEHISEKSCEDNSVRSPLLASTEETVSNIVLTQQEKCLSDNLLHVNKLGPVIEEAIRFSIAEGIKAQKIHENEKKKQKNQAEEASKEGESQNEDEFVDDILSCFTETSTNEGKSGGHLTRGAPSHANRMSQGKEMNESRLSEGSKSSITDESGCFDSFCKSNERDETAAGTQQRTLSQTESVGSGEGRRHEVEKEFDGDDDWW